MNNLPRQTLCELIAKYGTSLCDEPLRCEGLLRDLCGEYRSEINLLVDAIRERVASELLGSAESVPTDLLLARLAKRLQDHRALAEATARWVVESWALALGKINAAQLTEPKKEPAPAIAQPAQRAPAISDQSLRGAPESRSIAPRAAASTTRGPEERRSKKWLWVSAGMAASIITAALIIIGLGLWKKAEQGHQKSNSVSATKAIPGGEPSVANTADSSTLLKIGTGYRIEKDRLVAERYGFINTRGRVVIDPQWEDANGFREGLARVKRSGKYGFIDKTGRAVSEPQWEDADDFREGLSQVKRGGKWGFIDKTGRVVIEPQWEGEPSFFQEGLACVYQRGTLKYGFIDKSGRVVIEPQWEYGSVDFSEGLARVHGGGKRGLVDAKYGFIDKTGRVVIEPQWEEASDFHEGLASVKRGGKYGFIDKTGSVISEPQWEYAPWFSEGLAYVTRTRGGKYAFIDKTGRMVIDAQWDEAWGFFEGLARVKRDGKWGFIDKTGRVVIDLQWEYEWSEFYGGLAVVRRGGKWGAIDNTGRVVIEPLWDFLPQGYKEADNAPVYQLFARQEGNKIVVAWLDSKGVQIWSSDNQSR